MKTLTLCIAVTGFTCCCFAADPVRLKYEPTDPQFLVPVDPHGRQYEEKVLKILDTRRGLGTMIYQTTGEFFAVSVWGKDYANYDYEHPLHTFVTFLQLDGASADTKAKTDVNVPVDIEFAIAVQRAWAAMLLKSRYPEKTFLGADGYTAEFSVNVRGVGGVFGYTWSPSGGLTKEMVDLGFALANYCKASDAERPERREELMGRLQQFEKTVAAK